VRTRLRPVRWGLHQLRWAALPVAARHSAPAAAALLPRPAPGWLAAVWAYHGQAWAGFAALHGLETQAYIERLHGRFVNWSRSARIRVRIDSADLPKFLSDGRYRNQFDTGASRGALAPGPRMLVESILLGIPSEAQAKHRPVYGYLTGSCEARANVIKYGDVVLELRSDVHRRTTFTFGDSLDEPAMRSAHPPFCPSPLSRPRTYALDGRLDLLGASEPWQATMCGYFEAQVHGALTPRDVESAAFTLGGSPADVDRVALQQYGIRWRTVPDNEP
jgi:hypothetical protein